jgi:hypothetical protein
VELGLGRARVFGRVRRNIHRKRSAPRDERRRKPGAPHRARVQLEPKVHAGERHPHHRELVQSLADVREGCVEENAAQSHKDQKEGRSQKAAPIALLHAKKETQHPGGDDGPIFIVGDTVELGGRVGVCVCGASAGYGRGYGGAWRGGVRSGEGAHAQTRKSIIKFCDVRRYLVVFFAPVLACGAK